MVTIDEIDHELMEELSSIAAQGRRALEVHDQSPYSEPWSRDQTRHYERSAVLQRENNSFSDFVDFEASGDKTNPFGVINHRLGTDVEGYEGTLNDYIWDFVDSEKDPHPGRELGFNSSHDVIIEAAEVSSFIEYGLGYSGDAEHVNREGIQKMCNKANGLESYFDRLIVSF